MNNTQTASGNVFKDEFMNAAGRAGNLSANDASSLLDDRTRVSDNSLSRAELGYKNMDKILANDKLSRGKKKITYIHYNISNLLFSIIGEMLEMLQTEFSEVQIAESFNNCCN